MSKSKVMALPLEETSWNRAQDHQDAKTSTAGGTGSALCLLVSGSKNLDLEPNCDFSSRKLAGDTDVFQQRLSR